MACFDEDPNESVVLSGSDYVQMVDHIKHLEANQRTEITDEDVRGAVEFAGCNGQETYQSDAMKNAIVIIKQALAERDALKERVMLLLKL